MVVCAMIFNALDVPAEADHVLTEEFLIDGKPDGAPLTSCGSSDAGSIRAKRRRIRSMWAHIADLGSYYPIRLSRGSW